MATQITAPVVVGADGSEGSLPAVDLAADEASRRGRPLRVVTAIHWPVLVAPAAPGERWELEEPARLRAQELLDEAAQRATSRVPSLTVTAEAVVGAPSAVLVEESANAALLVVGRRGAGGFAGLLAGSVATQIAAHAHCPVLVASPVGTATRGRVVVGVDADGNSAAVEFAFEEAAACRAPLVAVHAWAAPTVGMRDALTAEPPRFEDMRATADRTLTDALAGFGRKYPGVVVSKELVFSLDPAWELVERSRGAALAVVGSRGRGAVAGLFLGSVGHTLVHRAECPVAVVRPGGKQE
ncbi:MAG: hypothetical protein QOC93_3018 [Actinomycetota bacterium]|jgi:nucleotide-binding universal stress UspA family protein|nr:universal stress protein UspA [Cryptosporangiaceae bacterium]MDQ1677874.1 hypothetical protein [Actinomycetota bacterium]